MLGFFGIGGAVFTFALIAYIIYDWITDVPDFVEALNELDKLKR